MARYWNYWDETNATSSTTTGGQYYSAWTSCTGSTNTSTTVNDFYQSSNTLYYSVPRVECYVITGFEGWSDTARAVLTRLINDETNTGFKVVLWAKDIEITDPDVMIRDLDWFLIKLRSVASPEDFKKISDHVALVRAEIASGMEARSGETEGLDPKDDSPTAESGDAHE